MSKTEGGLNMGDAREIAARAVRLKAAVQAAGGPAEVSRRSGINKNTLNNNG